MSMPGSSLPPYSLSRRTTRSSSHSQLPTGSSTGHHGRFGSMGDIPSSSVHQPIPGIEEYYSASDSPFSPIPDHTTRSTTRRRIDLEANNPPHAPAPAPPVVVPPVPLTVWGQVWQPIWQWYWRFYYSLFPRSEAFRTDFTTTRFTNFDADSTRSNDRLWLFYKITFAISMYGTFMSAFAGIMYKIFGEATSSPTLHLHSFKLNSLAANVSSVCLGVVFTVVYLINVWSFQDDLYIYKIREQYMSFVSLDLVVEIRIVKALFLTFYGFHSFKKEWGDWSIVVFGLLPFFYTMSSISLLKLFQHEFLNAPGLLRDFSVILVSPCYICLHHCYKLHFDPSYHLYHQYSHDYSILSGGLFLIAIVFGYITNRWIPYIYRHHEEGNRYAPDEEENIRYGPVPHLRSM